MRDVGHLIGKQLPPQQELPADDYGAGGQTFLNDCLMRSLVWMALAGVGSESGRGPGTSRKTPLGITPPEEVAYCLAVPL